MLTISGLGRWPQAASVAYFKEHCGGRIPLGVLRCITPGSPDAWITALAIRHDEPGRGDRRRAAAGRRRFPHAPVHGGQRERGRREQFRRWPRSADVSCLAGGPPSRAALRPARPGRAAMRRLIEAEAGARAAGARRASRPRATCSTGGHRPRDRRLLRRRGRPAHLRGPRRVPRPDRGAGARALSRVRDLHVRPVVPGPRPRPGPGAARRRGPGQALGHNSRPTCTTSPRRSSSPSPIASATTAIRSSSTCRWALCSRRTTRRPADG